LSLFSSPAGISDATSLVVLGGLEFDDEVGEIELTVRV
jgi:hypothetical protein